MRPFKHLRRVLAALAVAAVSASAFADTLELMWQLAPGGTEARPAPWLTVGNTERGVAYNPVTKHVYVVSRAGTITVRILDAATGEDVTVEGDPFTPKLLNLTGVTGGTFALSLIRVAEDGVIYGANLTTGSQGTTANSPFKVYRWLTEDSAPELIFSGDPGSATTGAVRWGDGFDVRGAGTNTMLLAAATGSAHAAVFRNSSGSIDIDPSTNLFVPITIAGASTTAGSIGVAFGSSNTAWTKRTGAANPLRHWDFGSALTNATATNATLLHSFTYGTMGFMDFSTNNKYMASVGIETATDVASVYDITDLTAGPVLVGSLNFPTNVANANAAGAVDFGTDTNGNTTVFFLDTNNGLIAARILSSVTPVSIATHPASLTAIESGQVSLRVSAQGTPPLSYVWKHAGTNIPGAPNASTLTITNLSADNAGAYTVVVSNAGGPVESNAGVLTVQPITRGPNLEFAWQIRPGDQPWVAIDNSTRGLAYNKVTGNLLLVSRTLNPNGEIYVINATNGAPVMTNGQPVKLKTTSTITGGTFLLNMIGVADDGAIYACNLTTDSRSSSSAFKVYRWSSESPDVDPVVVYAGNPNNGSPDADDIRFGDNFDVRGAGENTQILASSRNGRIVAIIKPSEDIVFGAYSTAINVPDAPKGSMGLGATFGETNSFYATTSGSLLYRVTFEDPTIAAGFIATGTLDKAFSTNEIPMAVGVVGYDPAADLLAGIALENPDNVRLYKMEADTNSAPMLIDQELFRVDNDNPNGTGAIDIGGGMLFALDSNSGIIAFRYSTNVVVMPSLGPLTRAQNGTVTLTVTGAPGAQIMVEAASSLTPTTQWMIYNVTLDSQGRGTITDAAAAGQSARFYRAMAH